MNVSIPETTVVALLLLLVLGGCARRESTHETASIAPQDAATQCASGVTSNRRSSPAGASHAGLPATPSPDQLADIGETVPGSRLPGQSQLEPLEDENLLDALRLVLTSGPEAKSAADTLGAVEPERLLAALAYALNDPAHSDLAVRYMIESGVALDERLVPFLANSIRHSSGWALIRAVAFAKRLPDARLIPPLLEHALDSSYQQEILFPRPRDRSVFSEAAQALWVMTEGQIGARQLGDISEQERQKLKRQWRQRWKDKTIQ